MTVEELERKQQGALPKEDLSPYAGQWVALRDGRVVAADLTGVALRNNPAVEADDIIMPVPPASGGVFIL